MTDFEKLKLKLDKDPEFKRLFVNVSGLDEAVSIAKDNGFLVTAEDISNDSELTDELLEAVAGGKKSSDIVNINNIYIE